MGLAACGGDDDDAAPAAEALELTIGDIVPLTGDFSDFGPPLRKAADLAIEQIQAAIDEVGVDHQVEIIHADSETRPAPGVAAARGLTAEGASCIAGAVASAVTIPIAQTVTIPQGSSRSRSRPATRSPASTTAAWSTGSHLRTRSRGRPSPTCSQTSSAAPRAGP